MLAAGAARPLAATKAEPYYIGMSLGTFLSQELPPLAPESGGGPRHVVSRGSSGEVSVSEGGRANRASVYAIPPLVMERVDSYASPAPAGASASDKTRYRQSIVELSGAWGTSFSSASASVFSTSSNTPRPASPSGEPAIGGLASSRTRDQDLPEPEDLLMMLAHRLARMHGVWRIHAPEEHHAYPPEELDMPLPVGPLITAVHEVLAVMRALSLQGMPGDDGGALSRVVRDHAVRVIAVVRSLDSENRVEWYHRALKEGTATHRPVCLGDLVSGGKQGIVCEFGSAVADLFLREDDEDYDGEEYDGEEYDGENYEDGEYEDRDDGDVASDGEQ
ncbi:hypothetical protein DFJ74DRAFT_710317 [Hyaloraphidium curvatum]|nr:hypothetical protein DFJ74DRAFT_710317 [Hyaloraphidium curvatum]